jgi:hypothetical protein
VFDGRNIWIALQMPGSVTKLRASDGEVLGTFSFGFGATAIAFDGANIWVLITSEKCVAKLSAAYGSLR